jgi:hypothetical protein
MNRSLRLLLLVLLTTCAPTLSSCAGDTEEETVHITGTVRYIELEGGFFGIVGVDGRQYDPLNLHAEEFRDCEQEGLPVEVKALLLRDMISIHQWGQLIAIQEITCR